MHSVLDDSGADGRETSCGLVPRDSPCERAYPRLRRRDFSACLARLRLRALTSHGRGAVSEYMSDETLMSTRWPLSSLVSKTWCLALCFISISPRSRKDRADS